MTKSFRRNVCLAAGALWLALSIPSIAQAQVLYDNSVNDLATRFEVGEFEVADQITLASTGYLTDFSFQFFGLSNQEGTFAGDVEARVVFYRMNGPEFNGYATPGSSFYDSGWFSIGAPTTRSTINFTEGVDFIPGGIFIPTTDISWGVQFRGMGSGDIVGLDLFDPPVIGGSLDDYWSRESGEWILRQSTGDIPINFAARFEANIPEPSAVSLLVIGGVAAFIMRRKKA